MSIHIDTQATVYVATDATNGTVHILRPRSGRCEQVEHLKLDDPDPHGPHADNPAVYQLLKDHPDMDETHIDL